MTRWNDLCVIFERMLTTKISAVLRIETNELTGSLPQSQVQTKVTIRYVITLKHIM